MRLCDMLMKHSSVTGLVLLLLISLQHPQVQSLRLDADAWSSSSGSRTLHRATVAAETGIANSAGSQQGVSHSSSSEPHTAHHGHAPDLRHRGQSSRGHGRSPATKPSSQTEQQEQQQQDNDTPAVIADAMDVWILAGQSNVVGYNAKDGHAVPAMAQPLPGSILAFSPQGAWGDAPVCVHQGIHGFYQAHSVGTGIPFARTLLELGMSSKVGLIPTALGGTNLNDEWQPGGELYTFMVAQTKAAMAAAPGAKLRGMVWFQGESDADEAAGLKRAEAYGASLKAWITRMRADLAEYHPCLPVVLPLMSIMGRDGIFPHIAVVRAQQQALQLPALVKLDMAGYEMFLETYPHFYPYPQLVHMTKSGQCALGAAMGHAWHTYWTKEHSQGAGNATTPTPSGSG